MKNNLKTLNDLEKEQEEYDESFTIVAVHKLKANAIKRAKYFKEKGNEAFYRYEHEKSENNWGTVRYWDGRLAEVIKANNLREREI